MHSEKSTHAHKRSNSCIPELCQFSHAQWKLHARVTCVYAYYCYTALTNNFPCKALSAGHWSCTVANGQISVALAGAIAELRPSPITEILPIRPPIYYGLLQSTKHNRQWTIDKSQSTIDNPQSTKCEGQSAIYNRQSAIHKASISSQHQIQPVRFEGLGDW